MQSQQKRVKWSRGETAEALEERTDTGITNASVELMENCIPDIYGNVSRRPALKPIPVSSQYQGPGGFNNWPGFPAGVTRVIPFYYTENDYYLIGFGGAMQLSTTVLRIKNGEIVAKNTFGAHIGDQFVSYAQQNNYMIITTTGKSYKISIEDVDGIQFNVSSEVWKYSAGWYAPEGTQTKKITNLDIPNLNFSGKREGYVYADPISGTSTTYSALKTGLTGSSATLESEIPVGSIIQLPNIGAYMRVEGYFTSGGSVMFPDVLFDSATSYATSVSDTQIANEIPNGNVCIARTGLVGGRYERWYNKVKAESFPATGTVGAGTIYRIKMNTTPVTEKESSFYKGSGALGSQIWYFNSWTDTPVSTQDIYVFGSLLTPIADENATDTSINIEYGYESLQPDDWTQESIYPSPRHVVFSEQRLWAGGWAFSATDEYAITIGSQIGRYNDFKNDYNQQNEPITLDILTQFKERIVHLIDYNGLKIMTDSYEYAYMDGRAIKQSANGSLENCEPIVFDSLCLYVDSTGCQVKAMEYEFQSNIFNSTTINQLSPHDLVWHPFVMASYEDKTYSTGKYLFLLNQETATHPRIAVCNFVPGNQANIWSRWSFPETKTEDTQYGTDVNIIRSMVNMKNNAIFFGLASSVYVDPDEQVEVNYGTKTLIPLALDFNGIGDFETSIVNGQVLISTVTAAIPMKVVLANQEVDVFDGNEYKFTTTTNDLGYISDDLTEITNPVAAFKINSTVRSHPIDVQGKTKSIKKRIGKTVLSVHDTEPGAIIINGKTGYMNPQKDKINFYGVTGMKDEIKYTLTNKNGAMFHLESLLMNIEYGTLIS